METNQNNTTTSSSAVLTNIVSNNNNTAASWNNLLEKMETNQIPTGGIFNWPNNYHFFQLPSPSNNVASGSLSDILGINVHNHNSNHNIEVVVEDHEDDDVEEAEEEEELGAMKEMMYKIAAMQPVDIDPSTIRKPKRRNVRISDDPQSVAARHRRERISEKIRILQRLVPGGTKMDTASMLDEAIRYVKFLKRQIKLLQSTTTQQQQQQQPLPQLQYCFPTNSNTFLLAPSSSDWPFAPNLLLTSTTTSTTSVAGGNAHTCHGSSTFNHHQGN